MILSKRSVILILINILVANIIGMALYSYTASYLHYLGAEPAIILLIVTIFPLTTVIFPPFLGKFSDQKQNRILFILVGQIGIILSFILILFTQNLIVFAILLFIWGFFSSSHSMIGVLYAELVQNDQKLISYYTAMISLGWFFGGFGGGIFIDTVGIQFIFHLFIGLGVFNTLFVLFIKENRQLILEQNQELTLIGEDATRKELRPISNSVYYGLFFRNFGIRPIFSIFPLIMALHLSSDTEIGFLIGINPLIQFFLMILIGTIVSDKNFKSLMIIGYLLNCVVIIGYIFSTTFIDFLIFQILVSLAFSLFWIPTQVYIAKNTTPHNKGKYMMYINTSFYLGSFGGGLFFSLMVALFSNYYLGMYFLILFPLISAMFIQFGFSKLE